VSHGQVALVNDTRNPKIGLVNMVFNKARPPFQEMWGDKDDACLQDMVECLYFWQSKPGDQLSGSNIDYYFEYPSQIFGDTQACCSYCSRIRYLVDPADAPAAGEHFYKCRERMASIGFAPIQFSVMHQDDWPDDALANAWWAVTGKNTDVFERLCEGGGTILVCVSDERLKRIIARIRDLAAQG